MVMQRSYRNNLNVINQNIGFEKRKQWVDDITENDTYLPKPVAEADMDASVVEFVKDTVNLTINGEKVPVYYLTIQRWSEFTKTWQLVDGDKNVKMPFITIVRNIDIQQGTNQAGLWNVADGGTYTIMKVPTWDGVRKGVDLYKIPQPTSIDLVYEVRLFANRTRDLNPMNNTMHRLFSQHQKYITVKGHPMPLIMESVSDESNIDDFENRRFYVQNFELKLAGYIMNEDDFKVIPAINRTLVATEVMPDVVNGTFVTPTVDNNQITLNFTFKPNSNNSFTFQSQYDATFSNINSVSNVSRVTITVNGSVVFDGLLFTTPVTIRSNDNVTVRIYRDNNNVGSFNITGVV